MFTLSAHFSKNLTFLKYISQYVRIMLCQQQSSKLIEVVMGTALEADHLS